MKSDRRAPVLTETRLHLISWIKLSHWTLLSQSNVTDGVEDVQLFNMKTPTTFFFDEEMKVKFQTHLFPLCAISFHQTDEQCGCIQI